MMLGRQRASVEEGRVNGGSVMAGGRKRAEEGLSEDGREQGRETSREVS